MSEPNTENQKVKKKSKHGFYFETPLYEKISHGNYDENLFSGDVDAYSNVLEDNTTYSIDFKWFDSWTKWESPEHKNIGYGEVTLTCKRKSADMLRFFVWRNTLRDGFIEKVGQDPSIADTQFSQLQVKYDKVLEGNYLKEFKRAVGLASHGVGVGSFVYLRRIFESLIIQTFNDNQKDTGVENDAFQKLRMEKKIDTLKAYLPSQLVKMKSIYGILSKGIHELDDEVCLKYFGPLKLSVELILDQRIEEKKKQEKDELVNKQIQDIQQNL